MKGWWTWRYPTPTKNKNKKKYIEWFQTNAIVGYLTIRAYFALVKNIIVEMINDRRSLLVKLYTTFTG